MAAKRATRPAPRDQLVIGAVGDVKSADRMIDRVARHVTDAGDQIAAINAVIDGLAQGAIVITSVRIGGNNGPLITSGIGSPENAVIAPIGSIYLRVDGGAGTSLYVKESGAGDTGWIGK